MSDDEDWDADFEIDSTESQQQMTSSLQRKLTIGNLSKKKSKIDLMEGVNNNNNNNSSNNNSLSTNNDNRITNSKSSSFNKLNLQPALKTSTSSTSAATTTTSSTTNKANTATTSSITTPKRTGLTTSIQNFSEEDDDDDDWDSHLESPSKSVLQARKESVADEWDADFGDSSTSGMGSPIAPQMKILGIRADPTIKTEWDDDFVFNDSSESENKSILTPAINILSRAKSGVNIPSDKVSHTVTELLSFINFGTDIESNFQIPPSPVNNIPKLLTDLEFKKKVDNQLSFIELQELKGDNNKLEISKSYYELGLIYQQQQQNIFAFNQFSTANKIYQDYKEDFNTPIDENNDAYELELYYNLGISAKTMANIFNATEYLKKALEVSNKDKSIQSPIQLKILLELGLAYQTTETPVYSTKYFEQLLRLVLFSHCAQHNHNKECLNTENQKKIKEWRYIAIACFQMSKTLKQLNEYDLALGYIKRSIFSLSKCNTTTTNNNINNNNNNNNKQIILNIINQQLINSIKLQETESISLLNELKKLQQQQHQQQQEADNTTAIDFDSSDNSDEDEEDWDAELGLDEEEDRRPVLQLAGQSPAVANNNGKDRMSNHYKLLDTINNQNFEIVKYPKPSYLYSMVTPDGHPFLHEEALSQWLSRIIIKQLQGEDRALRVVPQRSSIEELRNDYAQDQVKNKKNPKVWAHAALEFCYTLHIFGHDDLCWDTIMEFFTDLRDCVAAASSSNYSRQGLGGTVLPPSMAPSEKQRRQELEDKESTFHYALQMLYLASKLWTIDEDASYKHMYQGLRNLSTTNAPHVDIIVAECYSHHLHNKNRANDNSDDEDISTDSSSSENEEPEFRVRPNEFSSMEEEKTNPLGQFIRVYQYCQSILNNPNSAINKNNNISSPSPSPIKSTPSKISVSASLSTSSLHNLSPSNSNQHIYRSVNSNKEFLETGVKNAVVRSLVAIHFHLNGISPLTTKRLTDEVYISDIDVQNGGIELLDANHRMKLLADIYPEIPPTFLKAKAAYALGLNAVDLNDLVLAEKFLFECLYIIDNCHKPAIGLPLVLSELAANASISYASVLLDNFKYQYAIISYDNALLNYNIRKKKEYGSLLRKVAALARENDDIPSAIYYYRQILNNYLEDDPQSKTNEIIYLCETISTLYWEKGNYKQAEEYLKVVYFILSKPSQSPSSSEVSISSSLNKVPDTPRFDNPIFFQFQLKMAQLYLESYHFEKGLSLLEFMKKHPLPHGKLNSLIFMLAKAYTKKEWFDECTSLLSQLDNDDSPHFPSSLNSSTSSNSSGSSFTNSSGANRNLKNSGPFRNGGSSGNKTERNLKYWELNCLNYYHSNKFSEALVCIECAIETCPTSSLNARGHYFYIRGKVLQKLVSFSNATLVTFPTTLRPTGDDWKEIVDSCTTTNYHCTGDLIQECVASYKRAYHYFKSISDDVRIQKTVSRIAETYLDRVFGPVALLHYPFDDVARLPHFPQSKLIQKDSEQEQQLSDLKKRKMKKDSLRSSTNSTDSASSNPATQTLKEFYISFELIENPAILAMDINIDTCNILLLFRSYMNMAELKFLQGDRDLAISYWNECRNLYYTLFFDGPSLIIKSAPLQFIKKIYSICKRMLRFLFAFDQELINKNLMLIDSYLNLEIDIQQAKQRPIHSSKPLGYESTPQIDKIYVPYAYKSLTIGRSFKKNRMEVSFSVNNKVGGSGGNGTPGSKGSAMAGSPNGKGKDDPLNLKVFNEKTRDEEKSVSTGDEVGEKIWGSFHSIKNEIRKYSIGKITQEELATRDKGIIKQILKVMQSYKNHISNSYLGGSNSSNSPAGSPQQQTQQQQTQQSFSNSPSSGGSSPLQHPFSSNNLASLFRAQTKNALDNSRNRTPSNAGPGTVRNNASKYEEISFNSSTSRINASLQRLVISLQIDNYFIHYVPSSGRKKFNRIGATEELTPLAPPSNILYLEIYLLSNANEKASFVVSPLITLEKILLFLCNRPYWASPGASPNDPHLDPSSTKKKSFFGSFSRANQNSFKSSPKFIEKTQNFHTEFISFLTTTIGPPTGNEDELSHHVSPTFTSTGTPPLTSSNPPDSPPQNRRGAIPNIPSDNCSDKSDSEKSDKSEREFNRSDTASNSSSVSTTSTTTHVVSHQHQSTHPHLPSPALLNPDIHGRSMSVGSSSGRKFYSSQQISLVSMAKRMIRSEDPAYSKAYISIDQLSYQICKVFSHREMRECSEQNPLQLYLFVNSGEERKSLSTFDSAQQQKTNDQAITFTPEILSSFNSLLSLVSTDKNPAEEAERKKIVSEIQHTTFSSLFEILPAEKEKLKSQLSSTQASQHTKKSSTSAMVKSALPFGLFSSSSTKLHSNDTVTTVNVSTSPLLFICSKSLQIFPWELILPEFTVRFKSLFDILKSNYISISSNEESENQCPATPLFISCCYSQMDKAQNTDAIKKDYSLKSTLYSLYTTPLKPAGNRIVHSNHPYHSALIKIGTKPSIIKKKYKYLEFFDLSTPINNHITKLIDEINNNNQFYPIVVFTYNDLVDLSQIPILLLKIKPISYVLFIPFAKQKEIMNRFFKLYDNHLKQTSKGTPTTTRKERYQFLVSAIQTIKEEFYTPIVFYNPTFFVNNDDN
ncbi:hypothetical protein DICPUDRAFT_153830 [Dictyostelium purpureum]|uniref:Uncharacterized protein n=1 Tax=Dictyostelium purpureum TaxID=5786 RepID=F0ZPU8_DICPU|nr:uncharacterized protein DICPUDRAFT_153830 [Dictyostelium purpureum]EGC34039.1 hypothetical protein DICPUDRAFT_153830 [Dictyostelium purpureum]|eukprot:XP_003289443.1 hypothetical protein DICPUDRAFT_153830 [Dictyostelium purpureum]